MTGHFHHFYTYGKRSLIQILDRGEGNTRRKEKDEKIIGDSPFISTVGEKSMNGLGTYYGTFITEMEAMSPETVAETDTRLQGVPNFLTNPGKKGSGYGYLDITINPYPEYMEDPAFDHYEAHRQMREEFESRLLGEKWVPGGAANDFFDPNPFRDDNDPDGTNPTYDWDRLIPPADPNDRPIFLYSNHTKKINGNKDVIPPLERFPSYDPSDPWEVVPVNVFRQFESDPDMPTWKPQFGNRTRQQRSTICYNINLWVNATNFHMF
ncbi:hypothetical protein Ocin01_00264 [Orchesella cincta]|uniref:Cilia-and flagella-associated protein 96 n=1 Tax=Orchesella cincta TaxID=48709 RepID=A0A1D2NMF3_ORCCI|nr:hypothetical protein Ocin01_00264 [Orchesella cincta]